MNVPWRSRPLEVLLPPSLAHPQPLHRWTRHGLREVSRLRRLYLARASPPRLLAAVAPRECCHPHPPRLRSFRQLVLRAHVPLLLNVKADPWLHLISSLLLMQLDFGLFLQMMLLPLRRGCNRFRLLQVGASLILACLINAAKVLPTLYPLIGEFFISQFVNHSDLVGSSLSQCRTFECHSLLYYQLIGQMHPSHNFRGRWNGGGNVLGMHGNSAETVVEQCGNIEG